MVVETHIATFPSLALDCGVTLVPVDCAYETYGELNAAKSNAILTCHAFSGDAHAAGVSKEDGRLGWWNDMVGAGARLRYGQVLRDLRQRAGRVPRHHGAGQPESADAGAVWHDVSGGDDRRHGAAAEDAD